MSHDQKKSGLKEAFGELLAYLKTGISELDHVGVSKDKAAELSERVLSHAFFSMQSPGQPGGMPPQQQFAASTGDGFVYAGEKDVVIRQFKADVVRLGITTDDLEAAFGNPRPNSPKPGDDDNPEKRLVPGTDAQPAETDPKLSNGATGEQTGDPPAVDPKTKAKAKAKAAHAGS